MRHGGLLSVFFHLPKKGFGHVWESPRHWFVQNTALLSSGRVVTRVAEGNSSHVRDLMSNTCTDNITSFVHQWL